MTRDVQPAPEAISKMVDSAWEEIIPNPPETKGLPEESKVKVMRGKPTRVDNHDYFVEILAILPTKQHEEPLALNLHWNVHSPIAAFKLAHFVAKTNGTSPQQFEEPVPTEETLPYIPSVLKNAAQQLAGMDHLQLDSTDLAKYILTWVRLVHEKLYGYDVLDRRYFPTTPWEESKVHVKISDPSVDNDEKKSHLPIRCYITSVGNSDPWLELSIDTSDPAQQSFQIRKCMYHGSARTTENPPFSEMNTEPITESISSYTHLFPGFIAAMAKTYEQVHRKPVPPKILDSWIKEIQESLSPIDSPR